MYTARYCTQFIVHCTMYTVHCTLYTGNSTLDTGHWTLYTRHWTLGHGHLKLDTGQWTLDSGHWTVDTGQWTLDSGHWTMYTVHCTLWIIPRLGHFYKANICGYSPCKDVFPWNWSVSLRYIGYVYGWPMRGLKLIMWSEGQWEASTWPCDKRANERPQKKLQGKGTNKVGTDGPCDY